MKTTRRNTGNQRYFFEGCKDWIWLNMFRDCMILNTYELHPWRGQTSQHRKHIKREEADDLHEQCHWLKDGFTFWDFYIQRLHIRVYCWENAQGHEEYKEHVEQHWEDLLEDGPVRRTRVHVDSRATALLSLLFTEHLVVAIEFLKILRIVVEVISFLK